MDKGVKSAAKSDSVLTPLAQQMHVDFLCNEKGSAWLLHSKPLPALLKWIEYDFEDEAVTLVFRQGQVMQLGLSIPDGMKKDLTGAKEATVMFVKENGEIGDFIFVPVIVQQQMAMN